MWLYIGREYTKQVAQVELLFRCSYYDEKSLFIVLKLYIIVCFCIKKERRQISSSFLKRYAYVIDCFTFSFNISYAFVIFIEYIRIYIKIRIIVKVDVDVFFYNLLASGDHLSVNICAEHISVFLEYLSYIWYITVR